MNFVDKIKEKLKKANSKMENTMDTMVEELEDFKQNKNNIMNVINETMLGKVFGYFFND